jgi:sugar lactone lactonase YvrE
MSSSLNHFNADTFLGDVGDDICAPFFDKQGNMFVICQDSGEVLSVNPAGNIESTHTTGGQPSGAVYDNTGVLFVADVAHAAILAVHPDGHQDVVVGVYEDKPMLGPNSICVSGGSFFFTDAGPFGETGLHNRTGSVFAIANSPSGQILKPISLGNLAYPSSIAVGQDGSLYVAEMMMNRVLRFFQQPEGVYHGSVFHQLSGSVGPSAIAIDGAGNVYIAQYETKGLSSCVVD